MDKPVAIRAVVFDMDGVLTDSEPLINEAAVAMFGEQGLTVHPDDFLPFVGTGEDRYLGGVAEKHGFAIDLPTAKRRTYEIYLSLVPTRLRAFGGAVELIHRCREAGLKIAVASSADLIKIEANLEKIGVPTAAWDTVVSAEDVTDKKPAPDIFLAAARKLGVAPGECVVIEDAVNGVQAAKAAGMRCVAVAQSFPAEALKGADLTRARIADVTLEDLTGESAVTSSPPPLVRSEAVGGEGRSWARKRRVGRSGRPWGFWATTGFSLLIFVGMSLVQIVVLVPVLLLSGYLGFEIRPADAAGNGFILSLATVVALPIVVALCWAFAALRVGSEVGDYLGLRSVRGRTLMAWSLGMIGLIVLFDLLTLFLDRPVVPYSMVRAYETAGFVPLLWLAVVFAGPLWEELFFRGFMFRGYAASPLRVVPTILLTSLLWAAIHTQYDLYGRTLVFVGGCFLGLARWRTGSVYTAIALHVVMNSVATVEVALYTLTRSRGTVPVQLVEAIRKVTEG